MKTYLGKLPPWIILFVTLCTAMQVVSAQNISHSAFEHSTTSSTFALLGK